MGSDFEKAQTSEHSYKQKKIPSHDTDHTNSKTLKMSMVFSCFAIPGR